MRNPKSKIKNLKSGQALIELAVFGSLAMVVLGAMVSYGLNADNQQRATMQAFREAEAAASPPPATVADGLLSWAGEIWPVFNQLHMLLNAVPGLSELLGSIEMLQWLTAEIPMQVTQMLPHQTGGGSFSVVEDRAIPNPQNPFVIGSNVPVSASGQVIRDFQMHKAAGGGIPLPGLGESLAGAFVQAAIDPILGEPELPRVRMQVNGREIPCDDRQGRRSGCTMAGFRYAVGSLPRYMEIYGASNVRVLHEQLTLGGLLKMAGFPLPFGRFQAINDLVAIGPAQIIDPCMGQVISYDGCARIARQLVDEEACKQECRKGKSWEAEGLQWLAGFMEPTSFNLCNTTCGFKIPKANLPWYAKGAEKIPGKPHQYTFPELEAAFAGTQSRMLGLQQTSAQHTISHNRLDLDNTTEQAVSTTSMDWKNEVERTLVYRDVPPYTASIDLGTLGQGALVGPPRAVRTTDRQRSTTTWTTPWEEP